MEIPNYDSENNTITNFKRLYEFMPNNIFRMLLCSPSGGMGKTNLLVPYASNASNISIMIKFIYMLKTLEQQKYGKI